MRFLSHEAHTMLLSLNEGPLMLDGTLLGTHGGRKVSTEAKATCAWFERVDTAGVHRW